MNQNQFAHYKRHNSGSSKRVRQFLIQVRTCTYNKAKNLRMMPITTKNELAHIRLPLGLALDSYSILALYDTGAALNTGYLAYHQFIRATAPEIVHSYEDFNGDKPFDPIQLSGAIINPDNYDASSHGILSAVIRYKTPYVHATTKEPVLLAFALGTDMSVNSIIGLPFILDIELELRVKPILYVAHAIESTFKVDFNETELTRKNDNISIEDVHNPSAIAAHMAIADPIIEKPEIPAILHDHLHYYSQDTSVSIDNKEPSVQSSVIAEIE